MLVTRNLPPSSLENALLTAVEQARAGRQREIAVSLSMMLESLRREPEDTSAGRAGQASLAQA